MLKDLRLTIGHDGLVMTCQGCYEKSLRNRKADAFSNAYENLKNLRPIYLIAIGINVNNGKDDLKLPLFYCLSCAETFASKIFKEELNSSRHNSTLNEVLDIKDEYVYRLTQANWDKYLKWKEIG